MRTRASCMSRTSARHDASSSSSCATRAWRASMVVVLLGGGGGLSRKASRTTTTAAGNVVRLGTAQGRAERDRPARFVCRLADCGGLAAVREGARHCEGVGVSLAFQRGELSSARGRLCCSTGGETGRESLCSRCRCLLRARVWRVWPLSLCVCVDGPAALRRRRRLSLECRRRRRSDARRA